MLADRIDSVPLGRPALSSHRLTGKQAASDAIPSPHYRHVFIATVIITTSTTAAAAAAAAATAAQ